jgi:hypothetical protein
VNGIILSPQPLSGAGGPFPQAEIARVRKQGWINDFKTEIVFNCLVLHDFFNPFQAQDHFLV